MLPTHDPNRALWEAVIHLQTGLHLPPGLMAGLAAEEARPHPKVDVDPMSML